MTISLNMDFNFDISRLSAWTTLNSGHPDVPIEKAVAKKLVVVAAGRVTFSKKHQTAPSLLMRWMVPAVQWGKKSGRKITSSQRWQACSAPALTHLQGPGTPWK